MKDNLIRLLAAILLLMCLAATARLMGQNDSMAFIQGAVFTDPHDPPLGGDAALSILPVRQVRRVTGNVLPCGSAVVQTIDFQGICSGNFLSSEAECSAFSKSCNISPAICNLRPEEASVATCIFVKDQKQQPGFMQPFTSTSRCGSCREK